MCGGAARYRRGRAGCPACYRAACARPAAGVCARQRLAGLAGGLARGLVLVCAPAGSGKTVLLADWARRGGRLAAWLSLDAADNDPARFWRQAVAAVGQACPGIGELPGPLLGPLAQSSSDGLVTALINELAAAQAAADEVFLVLDDYHLIDSQPVHAALLFLAEHLPPGLRLVLASRSDPPLPQARLRGPRAARGAARRGAARRGGGSIGGPHRGISGRPAAGRAAAAGTAGRRGFVAASASSAQPTAPRPSPEHENSATPSTAPVSEPVAPSCQSPAAEDST